MPKPDPGHLKKSSRKFSASSSFKPDDSSSQENVNRIITFGSMPSYREDKLQELKRQQVLHLKDTTSSDAEDPLDETSAFIELSPNNLSRVPEKGILKPQQAPKHCPSDDDNNCCLNGYHEEILEALRGAAHSSSGPASPTEDGVAEEEEDDDELPPPCGPIRIRNLEDLLRQLEHRPSPAGSSPEADHRQPYEDEDFEEEEESEEEDFEGGGGGADEQRMLRSASVEAFPADEECPPPPPPAAAQQQQGHRKVKKKFPEYKV